MNMRIDKKKIDGMLIGACIAIEMCYSKYVPIVLFLMIISLGANYRKKYNLRVDKSISWYFFLFIITSIEGLRLDSNNEFSVLYNSVTFFSVIVIGILINQYNNQEDFFKVFIYADFTVSVMVLLLILPSEIKEFLWHWQDFQTNSTGYRLGRATVNSNSIAWLFGFISIFTFILIRRYKSWLIYFLYVLQVLTVLLTGSKIGLLLLILPYMFMIIEFFKDFHPIKIVGVFIGLIVICGLLKRIPLFNTIVVKRVNSLMAVFSIGNGKNVDANDINSNLKRIHMMRTAVSMIKQRPICGWGIGAFARYGGYGYYSHNNYLEELVSAGFPFFALYYGFLYRIYISARKIIDVKLKKYASMFLVATLLIDAVTVTFYSRIFMYLRILIIVQIIIIGRKMVNDEY